MDTKDERYTRRLTTLQGAWWKRAFDVQRPYRWNLRRLDLGVTLDIGCGIGRNLAALAPGSVGVDHNAASVAEASRRGLTAMGSREFEASDHAREAAFDSLLFAHVIEHMGAEEGQHLVEAYLRYLRPAGRVVFVCPQERGYAKDPTHVRFVDADALRTLSVASGLAVERSYSFPFPRAAGRMFPYNEFVVVARKGGVERRP